MRTSLQALDGGWRGPQWPALCPSSRSHAETCEGPPRTHGGSLSPQGALEAPSPPQPPLVPVAPTPGTHNDTLPAPARQCGQMSMAHPWWPHGSALWLSLGQQPTLPGRVPGRPHSHRALRSHWRAEAGNKLGHFHFRQSVSHGVQQSLAVKWQSAEGLLASHWVAGGACLRPGGATGTTARLQPRKGHGVSPVRRVPGVTRQRTAVPPGSSSHAQSRQGSG